MLIQALSSGRSVMGTTSGRQPPIALNGHQCKHKGHQNGAKRDPVTIPVAFKPERTLTGSFRSYGTVVIVHPACGFYRQQTALFFSFLFFGRKL